MRLSTYKKKFLALLEAVKKWRHYRSGIKFIIRTDQMRLKHLLEQRVNRTMQHKSCVSCLALTILLSTKEE
jgi:RNase H-like domain found in reverse transcriptase